MGAMGSGDYSIDIANTLNLGILGVYGVCWGAWYNSFHIEGDNDLLSSHCRYLSDLRSVEWIIFCCRRSILLRRLLALGRRLLGFGANGAFPPDFSQFTFRATHGGLVWPT